MATLISLTPNLVVHDVNKTVEYYTINLGFSLIASVPETGQLNWAMIMRDGVTLMFQSYESIKEDLPELGISQAGSMGTFFIEVENLKELYEKCKQQVKIKSDWRTTFYGKNEFTVEDLNGFYLTFAEDVPAS